MVYMAILVISTALSCKITKQLSACPWIFPSPESGLAESNCHSSSIALYCLEFVFFFFFIKTILSVKWPSGTPKILNVLAKEHLTSRNIAVSLILAMAPMMWVELPVFNCCDANRPLTPHIPSGRWHARLKPSRRISFSLASNKENIGQCRRHKDEENRDRTTNRWDCFR